MTDGTRWLAAPQSIAFGGYHVVLARGLSQEELAGRLAENLLLPAPHVVVPVGEHTGDSLRRGPCVLLGRLFGLVNRLDPDVSALLLVEEVSDEAAGLIGGLETTGRGPTRT
ncbi:hypothetical protein ACIBEA_30640 [Streptomyces sp. NPDC051555]|uniref:hypothetical protein n=1 Tax=Streptomyces sp. NPDC051555 TaxID=3365657 RepID=UPI003789225F